MKVCGQEMEVSGGFLRMARLAADRYESVNDPAATLEAFRAGGIRIDLFTFMQKVPDTSEQLVARSRRRLRVDEYGARCHGENIEIQQ